MQGHFRRLRRRLRHDLVVWPRHLEQLGQPEVQNLDPAVGCDHYVLGLEVAMHDLVRVCFNKRLADLHGDVEQVLQGQRPVRARCACSVWPRSSSITMYGVPAGHVMVCAPDGSAVSRSSSPTS